MRQRSHHQRRQLLSVHFPYQGVMTGLYKMTDLTTVLNHYLHQPQEMDIDHQRIGMVRRFDLQMEKDTVIPISMEMFGYPVVLEIVTGENIGMFKVKMVVMLMYIQVVERGQE